MAIRNELNEEISYKQLYDAALSVSNVIKSSGNIGNSIAIMSKDPIQLAIGIFGAWFSNKAAVPLHFSYPEEEINYRLRVSGSSLILTDCSYPSIKGSLRIKPFINNGINTKILSSEQIDLNRDALILFTSGTTGKPKGVVHSFETLSHQISDLHSTWEIGKEDIFFLSLPFSHIHGLVTGMLNGLSAGSSLILYSQFNVSTAWNQLCQERISFFTAVPTIYSRLLNHVRANKIMDRLDHLRLMVSGSSSLSEHLLAAWTSEIRKSGIIERYGMTETGMITSNSLKISKASSVGKSFPSVELRIISENENDEFGKVQVRGPGLFKGYLNEIGHFTPRNSLDFFLTGDQGFLDSDGDLKLVGRDRDILKVSGYKVGCGEIESAINNHPSVRECTVLGIEDPKDSSNQLVAALIVTDYNNNILNELREFLSDRLAYYKIPRKWIFTRENLPRNLIGKVDNKLINEMFTKTK